jgi:two-component system OmpR family sensor kinase
MRARWGALPLRTQLTALFAALLVVGLVVTGVSALALLRQSLVTQLDADLTSAAPRLLQAVTHGIPPEDQVESGLPSDYHVVFFEPDGEVASRWTTGAGTKGGPDLPSLTAQDVARADGEAFTVPSAAGGGDHHWRVLATPLVTRSGTTIGSIAVALPMTAAEATLSRMRLVLVATGIVVVGMGAAAGWWGVRRSLRPLRQMEDTAAAIAAGDLSRRVPEAAPTTEVGRLGTALNGMLGQVERAFAARTASEGRMRQFVADASHELRTPLATIRGYAELYRMGALTTTDELDATMRRMEESAKRMGALVEDLLHLARLDEGRSQRTEPVDLVVLAGDAAADLRALDPSRTVRLEPLTPGDSMAGAVVVGDEDRLRQVLANLVGNVATHTPAGSPAELAVGRLHPGSPHVVVEVRDHGPGIAPDHAPRVFERFYRADAARGRESGGAGLGMSIVAAIVAAHDGTVELAATPGGGTTVRVVLPAAPVEVPPTQSRGSAPMAASGATG